MRAKGETTNSAHKWLSKLCLKGQLTTEKREDKIYKSNYNKYFLII